MTSSWNLAPALEALVRGEHRRVVLVAPFDQLEEEDGAAAGDREIADLIHDQECGRGQGLEALVQASGLPEAYSWESIRSVRVP